MIENERIIQRIDIINNNLEELKKLKSLSKEEFTLDNQKMAAAKYFLQTSIEAMIDIGNHIIAHKRLGIPENSFHTFEILVKARILKNENLEIYRSMVKFRNFIVHLYHAVDSNELYEILLKDIHDFKLFIKEILKYLKYKTN